MLPLAPHVATFTHLLLKNLRFVLLTLDSQATLKYAAFAILRARRLPWCRQASHYLGPVGKGTEMKLVVSSLWLIHPFRIVSCPSSFSSSCVFHATQTACLREMSLEKPAASAVRACMFFTPYTSIYRAAPELAAFCFTSVTGGIYYFNACGFARQQIMAHQPPLASTIPCTPFAQTSFSILQEIGVPLSC